MLCGAVFLGHQNNFQKVTEDSGETFMLRLVKLSKRTRPLQDGSSSAFREQA